MWLLLAASVVAVAVFVERLTYLRRINVNLGDFLPGIAIAIQKGRYSEAQIICQSTPGPVARVMAAAISRHDMARSNLKEIVQEAGQLEVPRLESNLPILAVVAQVCPLVGLLGTVTGLIDAFVTVSAHGGYVTAGTLSSGVYQSLVTTAGGLCVAVPAYVAYSYLSARVNGLMHDMERAGIEIVNLLIDCRVQTDIIPINTPSSQTTAQVVEFRSKK